MAGQHENVKRVITLEHQYQRATTDGIIRSVVGPSRMNPLLQAYERNSLLQAYERNIMASHCCRLTSATLTCGWFYKACDSVRGCPCGTLVLRGRAWLRVFQVVCAEREMRIARAGIPVASQDI